ncbi:hypothetical protein P7C70_g7585, partial [Phenoliferia sp. Uapishka_3]
PDINLSPTSPPPISTINFSPPVSPAHLDQQAAVSPTPPTVSGIPGGPTVAETGAPIVGTGGPASGQLAPRPPPSTDIPPISMASVGSPHGGEQARMEDAAAARARADSSVGGGTGHGTGAGEYEGAGGITSREQALQWKEAEAAKDRLAAQREQEQSGVGRMSSTSGRRLEHSEAAFGGDEGAPPAYIGVDEQTQEQARR